MQVNEKMLTWHLWTDCVLIRFKCQICYHKVFEGSFSLISVLNYFVVNPFYDKKLRCNSSLKIYLNIICFTFGKFIDKFIFSDRQIIPFMDFLFALLVCEKDLLNLVISIIKRTVTLKISEIRNFDKRILIYTLKLA